MSGSEVMFAIEAERIKRRWQYLAAFTANLCTLSAGMAYGWSSPALLKLKDIQPDQDSWIASMLMIGGVFGCLVTSLLIDRIGRKWSILLSTIPFIFSWVLIGFSKENITILYVARFIGGLGVGSAFTTIPMYVGEVSEDAIRGAMGSLLDLMLSLGILIEYAVGPFVSFTVLAGISVCIPLLNLVCCMLIPESPYYLLMQDDLPAARKSLRILRGTDEIEEELMVMNEGVQSELKERESCTKLVTKRGNRKALIIILGLMVAQQLSGLGSLLSYTQSVFERTNGKVDPRLSTIGVGVAQLGACALSTVISDRCGRRVLLIISTVGAGFCLLATGSIFFADEVLGIDISSISDFSIGTIILYVILANVGLSSQPFVILSEIFPTNVKAVAVCVTNITMLILEALVTKIFEVVDSGVGMYMIFWIFSASCCISAIFIIFWVPETNGKSFDQIQKSLNKPNKLIKTSKL